MTSPPNIALLIDQARAGNAAALGQLLDSTRRYLWLLARIQIGRRLQGKADPDDVVQETFLDAQRQFPHFRGRTQPELLNWLRRILAGQIALVIRRYLGTQGRDVAIERELVAQIDQSSQSTDGGLVASGSTPSQHASGREQSLLLADALAAMSEDYREVIILRNIESLPFAEVAGRMGRSENSVQKLWVRALASLRGALGAVT